MLVSNSLRAIRPGGPTSPNRTATSMPSPTRSPGVSRTMISSDRSGWRAVKIGRRGAKTSRANQGSQFTLSLPRTVPAVADASAAASSSPASSGATWAWNWRPSSVSRTACGVRSNKRTPSRASSRATARLTPDGVRPRASPARAKLPVSTTWASTPIPGNNLPSNVMMISCHLDNDKDALEATRCRAHLPARNELREIIMSLNGKRIVVLGGSSGIGQAVAQAAAQEGAALVIASSNRARVDAALKTLPAGTQGHAVDLGSEAAIAALFAQLGGFDHLVYTAGVNLQLINLDKLDMDWARGFFGVRYWGAFAAVKYAAPHIRSGGSITLTSGLAGARPHAGWTVASSICS